MHNCRHSCFPYWFLIVFRLAAWNLQLTSILLYCFLIVVVIFSFRIVFWLFLGLRPEMCNCRHFCFPYCFFLLFSSMRLDNARLSSILLSVLFSSRFQACGLRSATVVNLAFRLAFLLFSSWRPDIRYCRQSCFRIVFVLFSGMRPEMHTVVVIAFRAVFVLFSGLRLEIRSSRQSCFPYHFLIVSSLRPEMRNCRHFCFPYCFLIVFRLAAWNAHLLSFLLSVLFSYCFQACGLKCATVVILAFRIVSRLEASNAQLSSFSCLSASSDFLDQSESLSPAFPQPLRALTRCHLWATHPSLKNKMHLETSIRGLNGGTWVFKAPVTPCCIAFNLGTWTVVDGGLKCTIIIDVDFVLFEDWGLECSASALLSSLRRELPLSRQCQVLALFFKPEAWSAHVSSMYALHDDFEIWGLFYATAVEVGNRILVAWSLK